LAVLELLRLNIPTIISPTQVWNSSLLLVVFCSVLFLVVERVKACALQNFARLLICDTAGVEDGIVWPIANSFAEVSVAFEREGFVGGDGPWDGDFDRLSKTAISFRTVSCLKMVVIQGMSLVACSRQAE
jgi:hypothetical protein